MSLSPPLRFEAVSYAWGDARETTEIRIDKHPFFVRRNLYLALLEFQEIAPTSWLWVDSIYIHQADNREKAWQVGLMGDTFGKAHQFYMWLGPGNDATDRAMDFFTEIGPDVARIRGHRAFTELPRSDQSSQVATLVAATVTLVQSIDQIHELRKPLHCYSSAPGRMSILQCIDLLLAREYWRRIWVVQEVALAQEAVVVCGKKRLHLAMFGDATNSLALLYKYAYLAPGDSIILNVYLVNLACWTFYTSIGTRVSKGLFTVCQILLTFSSVCSESVVEKILSWMWTTRSLTKISPWPLPGTCMEGSLREAFRGHASVWNGATRGMR